MNIFEITIQRQSKSGNWPIVVEQTSKGGQLPRRIDGRLNFGTDDFNCLHLLQSQPQDYGTLLGKALFQEQIRDAFVQAISNSPKGLRVLLFVEDEELKILYWQRLCAPLEGDWQFLALHQRFPFSLYLPSSTDRYFPPIGKRNLRAVIVVASPHDLERYNLHPFDVQATVESVKTALGNIPCDVLAFAENSINIPTLDNFCQQLTQQHYTLLHIVCHGKFINGDTSLFWSTPDNQVHRFTASEFLDRLKRLRGSNAVPYFAFLSTCESATPEAEAGLGGLGQRLVRELGMLSVVAMTQKVSINTASKLAHEFYQQLKLHGEVDLALVEATTTLAQQTDILVPALFTRLRGQPLFSETLDRELTNEEIRYGLIRLQPLLKERSPILLPQFEELQTQLQTTIETEPQFLSSSAQQERQQALTELNSLCYQVLNISFNALAFGIAIPTYDSRCPFQGLYAFKIEDQEFFFGRELLIENLKKRLTEHPFLAVVGNSGSGKSSLVLAGLIPSLQTQQNDLKLAYLTPKSVPIAQLNASLSQVEDSSFIIVVDQFEELFTLCKDELQRVNFIQELVKSSSTQKIVVTLRADFWGECAVYPELRELMETRQALIPPLNIEELGRVIEQQATQVRLRFEAGLRDLMLQDVAGEPGAMPLLQHALWQLWRRRHGRWLLCEEYQEIGKVQEAIAKTADDFYNQLSPQEQEQVRNIFIRLTRLDDGFVRSEQHRDTRRRVLMGELVPLGSDAANIKDLVRRLADERLVVTSVDGVTDREEVEVVHEALIQYWSRLQEWLNQDRQNLQLRERIRQQALDWQPEPKDELLLLQGGRLEDAIAVYKHQPSFFNQLEDGYIKGCLTLRERKRRQEVNRLRKWVAALSVSLVVAIGAGGVAFDRYQEAKEQTILAKEQEMLANLRLDATRVKELLNSSPADAMVLAIKATGQSYQVFGKVLPEVQSSLYAAIDVPVESRIFPGNGQPVTAVAYSPDGQMIASTREDGTIELLGLQGRPIVPAFKGNGGTVRSLAFNPKKEMIATGNDDGTIEFWNLQGRPIIPRFKAHDDSVSSLAFSQNGERLASGSYDTRVKLWNLQGKIIGQPLKHEGIVYSVAFSPNSNMIASGSYDKKLRLWNLQGTFQLVRPPLVSSESIYAVAFHPDGNTIATGNATGKIQLWNLQGQAINQVSPSHDEPVYSLAYSPDGSKLASGSRDNTIRLWNRQGNPIGQPLRGHKEFVRSVAFSRDGKQIISGGVDGTVRLWNVPKNHLILRQPLKSAIESVAVSPDGKIIAGGSADGMIFLWNQDGTIRLPPFKGHDHRVKAIAFNPNGTKIVTGSYDKTLRLWNTNGQPLQVKFPKHSHIITTVAFSPDGKTIATGTWDGQLSLWSVEGKPIVPHWQGHQGIVSEVAFNPENNIIASSSTNGEVKLWDIQGTFKRSFLASRSGVSALAFDVDGQQILTGNVDGSLKLWNLNGKLISNENWFQGHSDVVTSVVFSNPHHGEQIIVSGSKDNTLRLWDLQGNLIGNHIQGNNVILVAITPDGLKIISGSEDGSLGLWEAGNWRTWLQMVCGKIQNHPILQSSEGLEANETCANLARNQRLDLK
ncbi:nSTAND1 domain-containing NTPase [Planktothrix agardhii]|jgi:WD40 repeat protein|uniref:nSTAND1 domain-containing NTPase n=1 Tax=Planktothrix agardhii TaxID=1160 RepID=UPI0028A616C6|nr:CHAT domain-containing protein [Planktothrix agardhii]